MRKRGTRKNKGSAVIEMTLLMPVFLGCIYFYIMLFVFYIQSGIDMDMLAEGIYETDMEKGNVSSHIVIRTEGKTRIAQLEEQGALFDYRLELRKDENDPVENIRRWQLVTDTVQ